MAPRFAAVTLAAMLVLAAAVVARQRGTSGSSQFIVSAVVEVGPSSVRPLSAAAVRGLLRPSNPQALIDAPRGPHQLLIEYVVTSKGAPASFTGTFHVSLTPIVEDSPVPLPPGAAFKPNRPVVVAIALPDVPADSIISFARLTPAANVPPAQWLRTPMGQTTLPPVRR